jgi:hypothetical protein
MSRTNPALRRCLLLFAAVCLSLPSVVISARAQESSTKKQEPEATKPSGKSSEKKDESAASQNPAQIELLETKIRFETNGDSRKEVHALVHINSELGVRQFARLNFDYHRSFESVEIPLVRISHKNGGTSDVLPSAITDNPNPAVVDAPAYQDVRVKSVRILGLQPGDSLEYRVITSVSHHPLAPDFWLEHSFDRTGVVSQEIFEFDFPSELETQIHINPKTPVTSTEGTGENRQAYRWRRIFAEENAAAKESSAQEPDIVLTSFKSWERLAERLKGLLEPSNDSTAEVAGKASELAKVMTSNLTSESELRAEAFYTFVSQKIRTIDLPLGSTGFRTRTASEILKSGYATAEDKCALFAALTNSFGIAQAGLISSANRDDQSSLPRPSVFDHLLMIIRWPSINFWFDLNLEVAPFRLIPAEFRGRTAFVVGPLVSETWRRVDDALPFQARQTVSLDASISSEGKLTAKVHYAMRGDNELLLRVAFHQSPKEKWKEVAQLLALSDGFRGQVSNVTASDPYAIKEPFVVEYEISQSKFVDWAKKPVRIPALLPQVGLPDPPTKPVAGSAVSPIKLGTPLDVETTMTLHLPQGTTVRTPTGITVERDYATFSSQYGEKSSTVTASRHIHFMLREVPGTRVADYNAFLRAVQNDSAQDFTLERAEVSPAKTDSAAPTTTAPPNPTSQKP